MDGGEKSRQVGELDLIVEQLLVSDSLAGEPPLDAEPRCNTIQSHRAADRAEGDVVPDPIAASLFHAVVGSACEVHHRHSLEWGAAQPDPRASMPDDAGLGEPAGVEAKLRRV